MRKFNCIIFLIIFFQNLILAQDLAGVWSGHFSLRGSVRNWSFELDLQQDHAEVKGIGKQVELSKKDNSSSINSTFTIGGNFNGEYLSYDMEEILFLKSRNGQCLSKCEYKLNETLSKFQFVGECQRNGTFYKNNQYFVDHSACKIPSITEVVFEKAKDINGRKTEIVETVLTKSKEVIIKVWDNNKVDGDLISLNLNGVWILKNYLLKKEVKDILIYLPEDSNELILYAENLGRMPPNTAAISIWNGDEEIKKLVLNSDEGKSEAIKILKY
ncbi:hypothetical protein OAU10_02640 [Saprospiraceae bacterium]|nr:hypothetical protein [Saprospiraceae bacterium]